MSYDEHRITLKYISTWMWHIIALMFLISDLIVFALPRTLITQSIYVALFLLFVASEFMALKRKRELEKLNEDAS